MKYLHYLNNQKSNNVGTKNSDINEIVNNISEVNVNVPNGFATNDEAYLEFLQADNLETKITDILSGSDLKDSQTLDYKGEEIRELIFNTPLPKNLKNELSSVYEELSDYYNSNEFDTAVRESTKSVNIPDINLNKINNEYVDLGGIDLLYKKIQERYASLFTNRAIQYRTSRGYSHFSISAKFIIHLKDKRFNEKYVRLAIA
ncbi:PEP/pyruvate-binding domain-containing protein [Sulfurimonas sp.]|uniref:PEP/pyruvate-binding domain-containing protein n=1 Tax=Sulfurimonas sp. TaxID=2022749 RepID=UPI0025E67E15|nr:PEP/pyruvate-binding domain-containing protein [Sulfurimonas sp.]